MAPQLGERILGLPVEIQDQIFAPCLDRGRWRGVDSDLVPDLLVACRGDEGLYRRLLKIYYAVNSFCIDPRSIHVLNNLKPETTALMVHLEMLVYGYSLENSRFEDMYIEHSRLSTASNVETLYFYIPLRDDLPLPLLEKCLEIFPKLRILSLEFWVPDHLNMAHQTSRLAALSASLESRLIDKPDIQQFTSNGPKPELYALVWTWKVAPGYNIHRAGEIAEERETGEAGDSLGQKI